MALLDLRLREFLEEVASEKRTPAAGCPLFGCDLLEELSQAQIKEGHTGILSPLHTRALLALEAHPQRLDDRRIPFVAFRFQRRLEVCNKPLAELRVGLRAPDDCIEPAPRERQLLCGAYPGVRSRRKGPNQASEALFIERGHRE